jgi:DNA ligase D-like protein (predicted ligase)
MLATRTEDRFSRDGWIFERKLDGVRAVSSVGDSGPVLWSRNRKKMNAGYPELEAALASRVRDEIVVDGEIVAFEGNRTSFERLQPRIHLTDARRVAASDVTVYYYLFDILEYAGYDLTRLPLRTRKKVLRHSVDFADPLRLSRHRNGAGEEYYRRACERGWEGVVAKRAGSAYRHGRSKDWLKFTCSASQELVIGGFTEPRGSRRGFGALLVGYYQGEDLRYAGKVGTGYAESLLRSLRSQLDAIEVRSRPFGETVTEQGAHWVEPRLVAQIGFSEWTDEGKLRHPRFLGLRQDKKAKDVVREAR